jgi:hypothetical protein
MNIGMKGHKFTFFQGPVFDLPHRGCFLPAPVKGIQNFPKTFKIADIDTNLCSYLVLPLWDLESETYLPADSPAVTGKNYKALEFQMMPMEMLCFECLRL